MFNGSMVALVTPMQVDGTLDKKAFQDLVEWHIAEKTQALIVTGTTGESATLDANEQLDLITQTVKQVAGRIPVIAGTGTHSTKTTLILSENAKKAGASACLIVTPYYNKPTQQGLYQHYKVIAEKIALPIILYNVPGRTACDLLPETVEQLAKVKHIVGIKEATGKLERMQEIKQRCDKSFAIYSGDDATALSLLLAGAQGVISVTANVAPAQMHALCEAVTQGDTVLAKRINENLALLHKCLSVESNPIPVKWALHKMGKISPGIRLPLLSLDKRYHQEVKEAMHSAGIASIN
ncbi:MAG TPA: 4-hydroxy-tetrahydrodipicolinate synthase [Gammaproteobacteria bacterium]|jgi:4-hydroxy-tetrahydrodipicolinate synthase|nr:4-hydroxy-tetrahydrodipicolinate synthase [Gammaproteobacteria bacterium]